MKIIHFADYVALREGLWMNDDNAIAGLSRLPPPQAPKPNKTKQPPKLKKITPSVFKNRSVLQK
jgi:hypothetical protein